MRTIKCVGEWLLEGDQVKITLSSGTVEGKVVKIEAIRFKLDNGRWYIPQDVVLLET